MKPGQPLTRELLAALREPSACAGVCQAGVRHATLFDPQPGPGVAAISRRRRVTGRHARRAFRALQ